MTWLTGLPAWQKMLAAVVALLLLGGTGVRAWDSLRVEVGYNTMERHLQIYDRLLRKYHAESQLSIRDTIRFCTAAEALRIGGPVVRRLCR